MNLERRIRQIPPVESVVTPEVLFPDELKWFAGALEVGGVVAFGIQRRKSGHVAAYPYVAFSDSNEGFIQNLKHRFGGSVAPSNPGEWRLSGYRAAELVASTEPYTVIRRETVLAMRNWLESNTAERIRIAEEMKGYNRFQDATVEDYQRLVEDPAFVAGIIDNRGTIYPAVDKAGHRYTGTEVRSKNKPLLDTLYSRFGGDIVTLVKPGDPVGINPEQPSVVKRASYAWRTTALQARQLIQFVQGHLKIRPFEGWDQLQIERIRQERENQAGRVRAFVEEELDRFKKGAIDGLSFNQGVADKFGMSLRTVRRRLSSLPQEVRTERESILRSSNRRANRNS